MKNIKLKLCMTLCLLGLGFGSAGAQSVTFTHNDARGQQSENDFPWQYIKNLAAGTHLDWSGYKCGTDSWTKNGTLGDWYEYIRRQNTGYMRGDMFDWFTLTYTTPSYTKVEYKVGYRITASVAGSTQAEACRVSFFDYGTDANGYWSSRQKTSNGDTKFRTAFHDFESGYKYYPDSQYGNPYQPNYGESAAAYNEVTAGTVGSGDKAITWTIDNSTGSTDMVSYRRCGMTSSKTRGTLNRYTSLYMWKSAYNVTYYKLVNFNANGGTGTMAQQKIETKGNLTANAFNREGFTFAGWNTKADGTGTQYAEGEQLTADANNKGLVTLYAQWTAQPITAKFDYTYRTSDAAGGAETYVHMSDAEHEGAAITNKVRAIFKDHTGAALKTVVLTAGAATTPEGTPTDAISTHKTASLTLNVAKGTEEGVSKNGSDYTVTLSAANYANYRSVDFEVLTDASTEESQELAHHWEPLKQNATNYIFKYEGHSSANMFDLTWTVSLKNLSMYPSHIFVKPMRKGTHSDNGGSTTLEQIPAMVGMDGEVCELAGYIKAPNDSINIAAYNALSDEEKKNTTIAGAYYKGEYRVLKTCSHGKNYNYQLGLTGFTLDGLNYYLAAQEGDVPNDMISTAVATPTSTGIEFERKDKDIPVLILSPGEGATVSGRENYKLYVDNDVDNEGKREVKLDQFEAVRPNYDFVGWKDTRDENNTATTDGNVYRKDEYYHFNMGTKATTTLNAQWVRTNAPELEEGEVEVKDGNFVYTVKVTDELNQVRNVQYCYAQSSEAAPESADWYDLDLTESVGTIQLSTLNDKFGQHLWVKASNGTSDTDGKTAYAYLGEVRSVFNVTANPNPDEMTTIETPNGTWSEPTEENPVPVFTPDPNGTKTTTYYYDHYSTFYYSNRSFKSFNASVYTAKIDGSKLELNKVEASEDGTVVIPRGNAVILRKAQATVDDNLIELEECDTPTASSIGTNDLKGRDDDSEADDDYYDYYIFTYAQYGLGFYLNNETKTLAAHKAYIKLDEGQSSGVSAFILDFNESIVEAIREIEATGKTSVTIDLSGRKVMDGGMHGGIYMKGGSKLLK